MKITKSQLKQIIKEELNEAHGGALGPLEPVVLIDPKEPR